MMFPDIQTLRAERIRQKLTQGLTPAQIAIWFGTSSVVREIDNKITALEEFVTNLQQRMILKHAEKRDLLQHIKNDDNATALDKLCEYIQDKPDDDIMEFILVIEDMPVLARLGQFLRIVLERCKDEVNHSNSTSVEDENHWLLTARMEMQADHEDEVIEKISSEEISFNKGVLKLDAQLKWVKKNTILLQFKVMDMWDLHNLQCDILCGLFLRRLLSWLKEAGLKIYNDGLQVMITDISQEIGAFEQSTCLDEEEKVTTYNKESEIVDEKQSVQQKELLKEALIQSSSLEKEKVKIQELEMQLEIAKSETENISFKLEEEKSIVSEMKSRATELQSTITRLEAAIKSKDAKNVTLQSRLEYFMKEESEKIRIDKKIVHQQYREAENIEIDDFPINMYVYKEQVFAAVGLDGLAVYDLDLNLKVKFTSPYFQFVTSVLVLSDTDILVCDSYTGLHQLKQLDVNCILAGSFSDLCFAQDKVYALENKQGEIVVLAKENNVWVKNNQLELGGYWEGSCGDKLCATDSHLYVSSWSWGCVLVYSLAGDTLLSTHGNSEAEILGTELILPNSFASDVDNQGRLLVFDWDVKTLKVFDTVSKTWDEVQSLVGVDEPVCAVLGDRHLWVGTSSPSLVKYEHVKLKEHHFGGFSKAGHCEIRLPRLTIELKA